MVTASTNVVYDCATCAEPKYRSARHGDWLHLRADSLCNDDAAPVERRLPIPERFDAQLALLDHVHRD
jgi:hypothetical protein